MTDFALVVARAVHIGAAMLLFGELLFTLALAKVRIRTSGDGGIAAGVHPHIAWALVFSAVSWVAWLAIVAARMAGTSLRQGFDVDTMMLVLRESEFGHWWCVRIVLLVILGVVWSSSARRSTNDPWQRRVTVLALALAAIYLATLAFAGHATAATQGASRVMHLACDAMHALAAGAWLGALPALVVLLRGGQPNSIVARGTKLFSALGIASVSVLLASGLVNAWFLVGSISGLFGTPYGQLLVVKLVVFATMLSIAAVNRWMLTPRLSNDDVMAVPLMRRNATLEIFGGILIVIIVGMLGTMVPAAHQSPTPMHHMH
jgi:putative copper resistance protein D